MQTSLQQFFTQGMSTNWPIVTGNISTEDAKMIGITPAWLTFKGM